MTYTYWKVDYYPLEANNTWSTTATEVTSFHQPFVRVKLGEGRDTFEYKHNDPFGTYDGFYVPGSKLVMSRNINSTSIAGSDTVITGVIQDVPIDDQTARHTKRVSGYNFSEALMNALVFSDFSTGFTIPQAIEAAINSVRLYNNNFQITWASSINDSVKSDGSSFPTIYEKWYNKSLLELLEKYSSNEYTQDGSYYWYITADNQFVWKRREDLNIDTFNPSIDSHRGYKTKKDIKEVKNWVIVKGGNDPKGNPIQVRVDNPASRAKHGFKPYIITEYTSYANNKMEQDKSSFADNSRYPSSYPYVTKWTATQNDTSETPHLTAGSTVSVANDAEYNSVIRRETKNFLRRQGQSFINARKNGKFILEINVKPGDYNWSLGDVINVTFHREGLVSKPMRVEEIMYGVVEDSFTLVETVGSV